MVVVKSRALTPGQRFLTRVKSSVSRVNDPKRGLVKIKNRTNGHNCYGRITMRRRGGGHKRFLRSVDFRHGKKEVQAVVERIEYDPNRSANIALVKYFDGEKRYVLATEKMSEGSKVFSSKNAQAEYHDGMSLPLSLIPQGLFVNCVEFEPDGGGRFARSAGAAAQLLAVEGDKATLKMPSGEIRCVNSNCKATIGRVGNSEVGKRSLGKAGRNRWLGRRPRVRGVAMNPVDHPMGGGHGKTAGGGHPVSPWGQLSKGKLTRKRSKRSNFAIITTCKGRKLNRS